MTATAEAKQLSDAVVAFALDGRFPEDIAALPPVSQTNLEPAIQALAQAKTDLETEIHTINEDTREEVSSWEKNAKALQEDIIRSKTIANDIVRQSEAPETSGEAIDDAEEKTDFLNREVQYSQQLFGVLKGIRHVNKILNDVETASNERRVLDSLRLLETLDELGVAKSCRVMRLLDLRSFELKSHVHSVFDRIWKEMIQIDVETGQVAIYDSLSDDQMTLSDAVIGLKAFKEIDERMEQLWHNIDTAILAPRMSTNPGALPKIQVTSNTIELEGRADRSVGALLNDLEKIFVLLAQKLPADLLQSLCGFMMGEIIPRLITTWLGPAVPSALNELALFEEMIEQTGSLCTVLEGNGYTGFKELQDWVDNAPEIWLRKSRETALATIRNRLEGGIGEPKQVEKVEKHMVSRSEGKELATTGAGAAAETNEWDADWGDEWDNDTQGSKPQAHEENSDKRDDQSTGQEDDGADAWGWDDDEPTDTATDTKAKSDSKGDDDEDDPAAAWGWGEEDTTEEPEAQKAPETQQLSKLSKNQATEQTRELIFKETYNISSMPEPVLDLIFAVLEDAAVLTRGENVHGHVVATAPGLFSIPTSALALFRAISPHYYALDGGGNMFLYNDSLYLAERLSKFSAEWKQRGDLTPRAKELLQLDNDIKSLQHFANRSYASEMNVQKTVLRDLLGGSQSLTQQDEWESAVEAGTARIRAMAAVWEPILARSVWSQAIGSLAEALAAKLITDVLEMSSIGQDEAYSIAKFIATATELDDLFLPSRLAGTEQQAAEDEVPATAQYAGSWLRLKYLSEVLQSNLNEVKFLWLESELSLYFTVGEVVDLIEASFENNARTREAIKEIQAKPQPLL